MTTRKVTKRHVLWSSIVVAAWMLLSSLTVDSGLRNLEENDKKKKDGKLTVNKDAKFTVGSISNGEKPIMYTFYEPTKQWTGMSDEGDTKLLDAWSKAWQDRGWDTKILNEADAREHPDFDIIEDKLKALKVGDYNRRCYWRWLAMAAIEDGGWMSDYDLFPLSLSAEKGLEIAQDPSFKSFALHVPCLLHASRDEWDRIIHRMIDLLPNPEETEGNLDLTDMLSFREVGREDELIWSFEVVPQFPYSRNDDGDLEINCEESKKLAIHLSHYECSEAFQHDRYPLISDKIKTTSDAVIERGDAALYLMDDYKNYCMEPEAEKKPIMYTFYEPTKQWTGMSNEGDTKLLDAWSKAWQDRGWDTKILNEADARAHPDFDIIEDKLKALKVGAYNRRCYWRWLAMAAIEDGGWMSDYDLFPLSLSAEKGLEIAQDPSFKSFALHVPCLLHASRDEWDRIIHRMIDLLPNPEETEGILDLTDMLSLREVGREDELIWSWDVAPQFPYSRNDDGDLEINCEEGEKLAIHLSHYECSEAFQHDRYPLISDKIKSASDAVAKRGDAALYLMDDYNNQCAVE